MNIKNNLNKINSKLSNSLSNISNSVYFLFLVFSFIVDTIFFRKTLISVDLTNWHTQLLTVDYSYGFTRRAFLGTFTALLKNILGIEYITAIKLVQGIGLFLFAAAMLLFFYGVLKLKNEKSFCFITLLYISLSHFGFQLNLFGLFDTYLMAFTILMLYLIIKDKALFLVPVLSGISVLIHEAYPMMFFGVVVAVLIYRFCYAEDKAEKRKYALVFVITGLVVSVLFYLTYFKFAKIANPDADAIIASCREKLGGDFPVGNLRTLWIDPKPIAESLRANSHMWIEGKPTYLFWIYIMLPFLNLIVCSPLVMLVFMFWKGIIKNEPSRFKKALLILCSISILLIIPLIIFHMDQARWFYDVIFFEITVIGAIFFINANNERKVLSELTKIGIFKIFLLVFYFVFFFQLVPGQLGFITLFYVKCILLI